MLVVGLKFDCESSHNERKERTGSAANSDDFQNQGEMLALLLLKNEHFSLINWW